MLEILLCLTMLGVVLSTHPSIGRWNPYQIYFAMWFVIFLGYFLNRHSYVNIPSSFLAFIIAAKLMSIVILFMVLVVNRGRSPKVGVVNDVIEIKEKGLLVAQIITIALLPFIYSRAMVLSGGESIFSVYGYIKLRYSMVYWSENYGVLGYAFPLSFIITSLSAVLYQQKKMTFIPFSFSVVTSLCYAYLSTGRTFILLLFCMTLIPLVILKSMRFATILLFILILVLLFVFSSIMTAKGISIGEEFMVNVEKFLVNIRNYTITPFVAMGQLATLPEDFNFGAYTFRLFYKIMYLFGILDEPPAKLIKEYIQTPDIINVYTVYGVYFKDFAFVGFFIPPLFLIGHHWLYSQCKRFGGIWIFYYSTSFYPLSMQFFQDQYFSLLSQWLQTGFWYFLFLKRRPESRYKHFG